MGFKFSLATVLRVRGTIEEKEERILQRILYEISETIEGLARIERAIGSANASRLSDRFKPSTGGEVHLSYAALNELRQSKEDLGEHFGKLEKLRDKQLGIYQAARRNREMLTDMRKDKLGAYEYDMAQREQKTLDDNYIARRGRP
jgi:flagellar export protein FliJ